MPKRKDISEGEEALEDRTEWRPAEAVRSAGWLAGRMVRVSSQPRTGKRTHGALGRLAAQRWPRRGKLLVKEIITVAFPLNSSWK